VSMLVHMYVMCVGLCVCKNNGTSMCKNSTFYFRSSVKYGWDI